MNRHCARIPATALRIRMLLASIIALALLSGCSSTTAPTTTLQAQLSLPALVEFGLVKVGAHKDTSIVFVNTGTDTLRITSQQFTASELSLVDVAKNAFSIAPGSSQPVGIRYAPTAADTLGVTAFDTVHSNGKATAVAMQLHSSGAIAVTRIASTVQTYDFGNIALGSTTQGRLYVHNSGTDSLHILSAVTYPAVFSAVVSPQGIAPGDSGAVLLLFRPSGVGNINNGTLSLTTDATNTLSQIQLVGNGTLYMPVVGNTYNFVDQAADSLGTPTGPQVQTVTTVITTGIKGYRGYDDVSEFKTTPSANPNFDFLHWEINGDVDWWSKGTEIDTVIHSFFGQTWAALPFISHVTNVQVFLGDTTFKIGGIANVQLHLDESASYDNDTTLTIGGKQYAASKVTIVTHKTYATQLGTFHVDITDDLFYVYTIGYIGKLVDHTVSTVPQHSGNAGFIRTLQSFVIN